MLMFWHTFRSKKSCWFFGTLCILYFTYRGGFAPRIGTVQNTKCAKKSIWFFGSKSVPKNQHKLHVINNYICKLWVLGVRSGPSPDEAKSRASSQWSCGQPARFFSQEGEVREVGGSLWIRCLSSFFQTLCFFCFVFARSSNWAKILVSNKRTETPWFTTQAALSW